jgi:alkanesulfonate monooxygenase SsuD/methylene tetrahydromethanopterin reductase-like flavin-dependent oxidoreductase (luciferase family)
LDIASGGRLTLGVGVGGEFPVEFEAAGLNVKQRGRRTNECLDVMRRLWTGQRVTYNGRHFQLADASISPQPTQRPHPPIWIAGRRDAAMRRAVRHGDGWLPYFYTPERYRDSVNRIGELAVKERRDLSDFQWAFFPYISIYPTVAEAAQVAAEALGGRYRYGGDFVNIVQNYCLLGTPQQCIQRLQAYIDAGVRHVIFSVACPREDRARHIETIASAIIPHFRATSAG